MGHNLIWIGGIWLAATTIAWLICRWRGYSIAAWSVVIIAFCLGILIGAENSPKGRFNIPFLSGHHRHLVHHTATTIEELIHATR